VDAIRAHIDMAVFDLDDTLVPVLAQLSSASRAMKAYMDEHMPLTAACYEEKARPIAKE
jgi:FMN phosphatase YigB (HAD superfamily)